MGGLLNKILFKQLKIDPKNYSNIFKIKFILRKMLKKLRKNKNEKDFKIKKYYPPKEK